MHPLATRFAAVVFGFVFAGLAHAVLLPGGGPAKSDCYVEFQIDGVDTATSTKLVQCTDGDACDKDGVANNSCSFGVSLCVNQVLSGCAPPGPGAPLTSVTPKGAAASLPVPADLASTSCGAATTITVPVKVKPNGKKKAGRVKLPVIAKSPGKPKTDKDKATLVCNPSAGDSPQGLHCPANNTGPNEPNEVMVTVAESGTDLDNGWKGATHNFPYPSGSKIQLCLKDCDSTTDSQCAVNVPFGDGTFNGDILGPPIPIFTASVPVCVLVRFRPEQANETGTVDLATGDTNYIFRLAAGVYITEEEKVCPQCLNNRCDSGPRQGDPCSVDGTVFVAESSANNKNFQLSKACPPNQDTPVGTLLLNIPLTTGTSTLAPLPGGSAEVPCVSQPGEPRGVTPAPDQCGGGTCTAQCTGRGCVSQTTDPVTGAPACVDAKGGISQLCCSSDTQRPCFPTRAGNPIGKIERLGKVDVPQPPWPDPTYPKMAHPVTAGVFCEPGTGTGSVDGLTGLPGPASLTLPSTVVVYTPATAQ